MDKHPRKKAEEKREATKKFFNMWHDIFENFIPNLVQQNNNCISAGAIALFFALLERANHFAADFNDYFYITDDWLTKALNITRDTVRHYKKELAKVKLIYYRPGEHRGCASVYFIPYPYNPERTDNPMDRIENWEKVKLKLLKQARQYKEVEEEF
jgi:hypothetical protein